MYREDLLQRAAMFERAAKIIRSQVPIGNPVWLKSIVDQKLGNDVANFVADASHIWMTRLFLQLVVALILPKIVKELVKNA